MSSTKEDHTNLTKLLQLLNINNTNKYKGSVCIVHLHILRKQKDAWNCKSQQDLLLINEYQRSSILNSSWQATGLWWLLALFSVIKGEESKNNFCRRQVTLGTIPDGTHYKITKPIVYTLKCGAEKKRSMGFRMDGKGIMQKVRLLQVFKDEHHLERSSSLMPHFYC